MFTKARLVLAACAAMVFAAGIAIAQVPALFLTSPTGTEQINVLGNGPQIETVTINTLRNTTGYLLSAAVTGTVATTTAVNNLIFTAALTGAVTVDVPPSPADGELFSVTNGSGSAFTQTITVASTDSSTFVGSVSLATLAASTGAEYQYTAAAAKWYRVR